MLLLLFHYHILINYDRLSGISFVSGESGDIQMNIQLWCDAALPQVLLPASSILQLVSVREACCKFLMRQLHPTNCLGIRNFADTHACKELHKRSHKFALENFQEVMNTEEFLLLPFQEVSRKKIL